jgi:predicted NAD/FAD-dependent oxidoreductase
MSSVDSLNNINVFDAIVLGAGMSGLVLAQRLSELTNNFLILEKSNGVGGRVATRRDGDDLYDHGAQFYKISRAHENTLDQSWTDSGLSVDWFKENDTNYKISRTGMTAFAKSLAENKPVIFKKEISSLKLENGILSITCVDHTIIKSKKYILRRRPLRPLLFWRDLIFLFLIKLKILNTLRP